MSTAANVTRLAAYFGAIGGGAPNYANPPSEEWEVVSIDESDPAHPKAQLRRALTDFIVDRTSLFSTREVHIWACDTSKETDASDYRVIPLFKGEVYINRLSIRIGETETAIGEVKSFHYGTPAEGELCWDPVNEQIITVNRDIRFNPTIDGKIVGNMLADRDANAGFPDDYQLWLDPESTRTDEALDVFDQTEAANWTLGAAVEALQRTLNADETFIENITVADDPTLPSAPFDDAEEPQNVTIPRNSRLDQALARLLPQYGFGYYLKHVIEGTGDTRSIKTELAYYKRGSGTEKTIKLQVPGNTYDPDDTDLLTADITFDTGNLVNKVIIHGHPPEREVTIELVKGWAEASDGLTPGELKRGDSESSYGSNPLVWRLWVANEAGDFNGTRTEITAALDLSDVFTDGYTVKRRKLHSPLTYRNGIRGPVLCEYSTDDGASWTDVTGEDANAEFEVLEDQIGVYFNQPTPPVELWGDDVRIRVTGTIVGDIALKGEADVETWAPNQQDLTLIVPAADRYFDRARQTTGDLASSLSGDHDSQDDADAITAFAEELRDQNAAASVDAQITITSITDDYAISDLITGISGRNISFNRSADSEAPLYVQVVGRIFDGKNQTTTIIVRPYDLPRSQQAAPSSASSSLHP